MAMLRFHNAVVDAVVASGFSGDVFVEAKQIVTRHYQWAVVHDFLTAVCGAPAVANALASVSAPSNSAFRMPVEFSVAAFRFGHSMIRDTVLGELQLPRRHPRPGLRVQPQPATCPCCRTGWSTSTRSSPTGVPVPVFNKARKIDTGLANGLTALPGFTGMMADLATRNLLRSLALGLPSGQGMAKLFGLTPLTAAELTARTPTR